MKKVLLSSLMTVMMTGSAMAVATEADQCKGGTVVENLCISNVSLNWWNASNWCEAHGLQFARMYDICPDWSGHSTSTSSDNSYCRKTFSHSLGSSDTVWSSTASWGQHSFMVKLSTGAVWDASGSKGYANRASSSRAACVMR